MSYIKPMNCKAFTDYLLTLKTVDKISFACSADCDWPNEIPESDYDVSDWYFAKVMSIPEYMSRFILIDYAGGEEAFAIPLNNYRDYCDDDDKTIVPVYVKRYFESHNRFLNGADAVVFVEMEDEE